MSNGGVVQNPVWADIAGMFFPYIKQMMWRLDLSSYDDVRANANLILSRINAGGMPPPPFPSLSQDQIDTFTNWLNADCPEYAPPAPTTQPPAAAAVAGGPQPRPLKFP